MLQKILYKTALGYVYPKDCVKAQISENMKKVQKKKVVENFILYKIAEKKHKKVI